MALTDTQVRQLRAKLEGKHVSSHDTAKSFIEALKQGVSEAHDIELLYDV